MQSQLEGFFLVFSKTGPKRVLHLILGLSIGQPLGGAEKAVIELVEHIDRAKYDPIVCAFWRHHTDVEKYWSSYLHARGIRFFFAADWRGRYSLRAYVRGMQTIRNTLHCEDVALVHTHFQMGALMALLLRPVVRPQVLVRTAHASKEWGDGTVAWLCRQVFTKLLFPLTFDAQVANSRSGKEGIDQYLGTVLSGRPTRYIPNGVNTSVFGRRAGSASVRASFGLAADDIVVGSVGRLSPEKGHAVLLEAAVAVREKFPQVKLLVIGDGVLRRELELYAARLNLEESVVWVGARTDVESLYCAMDLFVLPSRWEAFGIVLLESMASGVPVVASDLPGVRELVDPGVSGWVARAGSAVDLAAAITDALSRPVARARVAEAAFAYVASHYSVERMAGDYQRLYDELCTCETTSPQQMDAVSK